MGHSMCKSLETVDSVAVGEPARSWVDSVLLEVKIQ